MPSKAALQLARRVTGATRIARNHPDIAKRWRALVAPAAEAGGDPVEAVARALAASSEGYHDRLERAIAALEALAEAEASATAPPLDACRNPQRPNEVGA